MSSPPKYTKHIFLSITDVLNELISIPHAPQHDAVFVAAARALYPLTAHMGVGVWAHMRSLLQSLSEHELVAVREAVAEALPSLAR